MTDDELVELEIEKRALLETVRELSRGDARMEVSLDALCERLVKRAKDIQKIIDNSIEGK